jgi:hypothetical protein
MNLITTLSTRLPDRPSTRRASSGRVARVLRSRAGIIALAAVAVGVGLWLGWGWLVAAGLAPFVISVLPCLAMCAIGVCAMGRGGRSCASEGAAATSPDQASAAPSQPLPR